MGFKKFSRKWKVATLGMMLIALSGGVVSACSERKPVEEPTKGLGVFYFDAGIDEYQLSLGDGNKLTYIANGEVKTGTYTTSDNGIVIQFDGEETSSTATFSGGILTWTDGNTEMRFYKKVFYKVSYDEMGGAEIDDVTVVNGKTVAKPADPVRVGYEFLGWYADADYTTPYMFDTQIVTSDVTIYAQWALVDASVAAYEVDFDLGYEGGDVPAVMETIGGKLYNAPVPKREGYKFCGWWISNYEDGTKLTYKYTPDTVFTANTTLFAVWESEDLGDKLSAPQVEVFDNMIKWDAVEGGRGVYTVKIKGPDVDVTTAADGEEVSGTVYLVDFASADPGDYEIEVTAHAYSPENNSDATVRVYQNKAVGRVSQFSVLDGRVLLFNRVDNAEGYYITVVCGNEDHSHINYNNGESTYYNFANCDMKEGGIEFTVTAYAKGYASVVSETFVYNRVLDKVEGLTVDEETETVSWYAVKDATGYVVSVSCGDSMHEHEFVNVGSKTSFSLKECTGIANGNIVINVYPVTKGYNSPEAAQITYNKKNLASPRNISVANTADGYVMTWNAVAGATSYSVKIDNVVVTTDTNSINLTNAISWVDGTEYEVTIQAKNDTATSLWSDVVPVRYYMMPENLSYKAGVVSWSAVMGATAYEVKVNDSGTKTVTDAWAAIDFTQAGDNIIRVRFIDESKNYYPSEWAEIVISDVQEISFDSRGGSPVASQYKATGDAMTLEQPTRDGYDFVGWYNTPKGPESNGMKYEDGYFTENQEIVLYAYWTPAGYEIEYAVGDGGTMTATKGQVFYTKDYKLDVPTVEDGTKVFLGWFAGNGSTSEQLTDDRGYSIKPWSAMQGATVYAQYISDVLKFNELEDKTYSVTRGINATKLTSITIPAMYNSRKVTVVDGNAFQNCTKLVSVNIPDTIELISEETAFLGCKRLEEVNIIDTGNNVAVYSSHEGVLLYKNEITGATELSYYPIGKKGAYTIPDGVTEIPLRLFEGTQITEVTIPTSVAIIREKAFYGCTTITKVSFAEGGTDGLIIEDGAFQNCTNLTTLTLPARLTELQVNEETHTLTLFAGCNALTHINIEKGNQNYSSIDGVITNKTGQLIFCPAARKGSYQIPRTITSIAPYAFYDCKKLTEIIIPGYVDSIGEYAFAGCSKVARVVFSEGAVAGMSTVIGEGAFSDMANLREVKFDTGSAVTEMGAYAFANAPALSNITFPTSMTYVGDNAFENATSLHTVSFANGDEGNLEFGNYVFSECKNLVTVNLPKSVTKLNLGVFDGCVNISNIFVDDANDMYKDIDGVVFTKDGKELVFFPKGRTTENGEYDIPDGVEVISEGAFKGLRYITTIVIDNTITYIGKNAFTDSQMLTTLTFAEGNDDAKLVIAENAFAGCAGITSVALPNRTEKVMAKAFYNVSMTEVSFPEGLTEIGDYAFSKTGIAKVEIPAGVTTFGFGVFADNPNLASVTFAKDFAGTAIPSGMFKNTAITSITIPGTIEKISYEAFNDCTALTEVIFNDGTAPLEIGPMDEEGNGVFANCTNLKTITIPARTIYIGNRAFEKCSSIEDIGLTKGSQLQRIGNFAFSGCLKLGSIYIAKTVANTPYVDESNPQLPAIGVRAFMNSGISNIIFEEGGEGDFSFGHESLLYCGKDGGVDGKGNPIKESIKELNLPARLAPIYTMDTDQNVPCHREGFQENVCFNGKSSCEMQKVNVAEGSKYYVSQDGVFYKAVERNGEYVADVMLFCSPWNPTTTITVPWTVSKLVTGVMQDNDIVQYVNYEPTPEGETYVELTIEASAFTLCGALKEAILPERLVMLGQNAFKQATAITKVQIPSTLAKWGVDSFNPADSNGSHFYGCTALKEIVWPETAAFDTLPGYVFYGCTNTNFKTLNIPYYIQKIGPRAFYNCTKVTTLNFGDPDNGKPSQLRSIGALAFYGMTLKSLVLPDSITTLSGDTFGKMSSLTSLTLPASLTSVSAGLTNNGQKDFIFEQLTAIKEIKVSPDSKFFTSIDGVLYSKHVTDSGEVRTPELVYWPKAKTISYTDENGTTTSGKYVAPAGVTSIGAFAFYKNTNLKSLVLSKEVTTVGAYAFTSCTNLASFTVEKEGRLAPITLGDYAFQSTSKLTGTFTVPKEMVIAGKGVFSGARFDTVIFEAGNKSTSLDATFSSNTYLKTVQNLPTSVPMYYQTFSGCKNMTSVTFENDPNGFISEMKATFKDCAALTHIDLPSVGSLASNTNPQAASGWQDTGYQGCFEGCTNLKTITMKDCTVIGTSAFKNCKSLVGIYDTDENGEVVGTPYFQIPETVMSLGAGAFYGCTSLQEVRFPGGIETIQEYTFAGCTSMKTVNIPDFVSDIKYNAFYNCHQITDLSFGAGIINIGDYAFYNAANVKAIVFEEGIETIGAYAFYNCAKITSLDFPSTLKTVGDYAFFGGKNIETLTAKEGLEWIGDYATAGFAKVTVFSVPSTVSHFGTGVFDGWVSLKDLIVAGGNLDYAFKDGLLYNSTYTKLLYVSASTTGDFVIPDTVLELGARLFANSKITSIVLPDTITEIPDEAFRNCTELTSIKMPATLTKIGYAAFAGCTSLKEITIPKSVHSTYKLEEVINQEGISGGFNLSEDVDGIGKFAFANCTSLTNVIFEEGGINRLSIGDFAFYGCSSLKGVEDKETGEYVFTIPNRVRSVGVPYAVQCMGPSSFGSKMSDIKQEQGIGMYAFYGCSALENVVFAEQGSTVFTEKLLIMIGAFQDCRSLKSVTFNEALGDIILTCLGEKGMKTEGGLVAIQDNAFNGCGLLTTINFSKKTDFSTFYVSSSAFAGTSAKLPGEVQIGEASGYEKMERDGKTAFMWDYPPARTLTINGCANGSQCKCDYIGLDDFNSGN